MNKPTYTPSFKHEGLKIITDETGKWTGEWKRDSNGNPIPFVCHYMLTDGIIHYCGDCTHEMSGKSIPLQELPKYYRDE